MCHVEFFNMASHPQPCKSTTKKAKLRLNIRASSDLVGQVERRRESSNMIGGKPRG